MDMKPFYDNPIISGKAKAKLQLFFCLSTMASVSAPAQTTFTTNSLPCQFGEDYCSYYSTNVNVTAMLALATNGAPPVPGGGTNVSQFWDFSQAEQPCETVLRTDIIAPEDGANSGQFPDATYAEQDTLEPTNQIGWLYYGFTDSGTNSGRLCYGIDAPEDVPVTEWAVFVPPTVDIPSTVQFGQTWSGSLYWLSIYFEIIPVSNYYSYSASVDAFGTLVLPEIGAVPALRVHEIESYTVSVASDPPLLLDINTNQYYYWLVPGIGVAAQVLLLGNNVLYPTDLPYTNMVQRMYYASYFTNSGSTSPPSGPTLSPFPTDLYIQEQSGSVVLNWTLSNAVNFRIDYTGPLATNWQALGNTTSTSWTDTITAAQRFYRVVGLP
jgi:hypothetical protein